MPDSGTICPVGRTIANKSCAYLAIFSHFGAKVQLIDRKSLTNVANFRDENNNTKWIAKDESLANINGPVTDYIKLAAEQGCSNSSNSMPTLLAKGIG